MKDPETMAGQDAMTRLVEAERALHKWNRRLADPPPHWGLVVFVVLAFAVLFAAVALIAFCGTPREAMASLPSVLWRGEKTVTEWYAAYPPEPGKSWADKVNETCQAEVGFLVVTESSEQVSYLCILRVDAWPPVWKQGA